MNTRTRQILLPLLTALIWGTAFVAQKSGSETIGAFTFTWTRYLLAGLTLLCFLAFRVKRGAWAVPDGTGKRALLRGGFIMGTLLMAASNLQQYGIKMTTAGKAGFITALYIVLVPLLGLFLHKRVSARVWCGVGAAVAGLYFLSFASGGVPSFTAGDLFVFFSALVFAVHILVIDYYTKYADGVALACLQFLVAAAESLALALVFEGFPMQEVARGIVPILYAGLVSGGVGYTLQIIALRDGDPTVVSLLLSLESFFAAASGAILLHEHLTMREYLGCGLMLFAAALVQLPEKTRARNDDF